MAKRRFFDDEEMQPHNYAMDVAVDIKFPAFTLLGCGRCAPGSPLATRLEFLEIDAPPEPELSWCEPVARENR